MPIKYSAHSVRSYPAKSKKTAFMQQQLAITLRELAKQYEMPDFLQEDPSQFMHRYSSADDAEVVALFSACLAFGKRSEILSHIEILLDMMQDVPPSTWIRSGIYKNCLPLNDSSFYRVFSNKHLRCLCESLQDILRQYDSLGECCFQNYRTEKCQSFPGRLAALLANLFPKDCGNLIPHGKNSANKRLNLFLRWMVRQKSPVDLGLWKWYPASELLIPMDVHVLNTAKQFGLLPANATANLKYTLLLTNAMAKIFPGDPTKADFALFGYGINKA